MQAHVVDEGAVRGRKLGGELADNGAQAGELAGEEERVPLPGVGAEAIEGRLRLGGLTELGAQRLLRGDQRVDGGLHLELIEDLIGAHHHGDQQRDRAKKGRAVLFIKEVSEAGEGGHRSLLQHQLADLVEAGLGFLLRDPERFREGPQHPQLFLGDLAIAGRQHRREVEGDAA